MRLAEVKAGKGAKLTGIGISTGRGLMEKLATEYVKAKAAAQLQYVSVDSDMAAMGVFVSSPATKPAATQPPTAPAGRELLLLDDRPSARAIEAHGDKWNALNPTEYLIAGRAVAVIVNPLNKLDALTLDQIRMIFAGEIEDWSVLGSTGLKPVPRINVFGLRFDSAHRERDTNFAAAVFYNECLPADKFKRVTLKKDTA
jgi:ABC-type phosphate transport system substrate-binding protein